MTLLNCPALPEFDGKLVPVSLDQPKIDGVFQSNVPTHTQRWYINGEVKCFQGPHAALALLAIVVLTLCIALIPLMPIIAFDKIQVRIDQHDYLILLS